MKLPSELVSASTSNLLIFLSSDISYSFSTSYNDVRLRGFIDLKSRV